MMMLHYDASVVNQHQDRNEEKPCFYNNVKSVFGQGMSHECECQEVLERELQKKGFPKLNEFVKAQ